MFTGIITDIGQVVKIDDTKGDITFRIDTSYDMSQFKIGASIACSGCCLTVVNKGDDWFEVDVSAETTSKTNLGNWKEGTYVNLESSLRLGDEFGGHVVSGHVDGLATLQSIEAEGDSHRLKFEVPQEFAGFVAPKGSIALAGVSLTVNEVDGNVFGVNIIPHTWDHTNFSHLKVGDTLNFEIDMLARYVSRLLEVRG